jgi:hypothetical protein
MSLIIFTALNVAGIGFFLYVLVNFWKEGHKSRGGARSAADQSGLKPVSQVVVVCAPMAASPRRDYNRLIKFPVRAGNRQQPGNGSAFPAPRPATPRSLAR